MDDKKLNYCQVVLENCKFKLPTMLTSPTNNLKFASHIGSRRQSIRLQDKDIPCMKETTLKKSNKRQRKGKSNEKIQKPIESSIVSTANEPQNDSNPLQLSDNDILEMLGDFAAFIEDGDWDPTSDIFNSDEVSCETIQSKSDQIPDPTTPDANASSGYRSSPDEISEPTRSVANASSQCGASVLPISSRTHVLTSEPTRSVANASSQYDSNVLQQPISSQTQTVVGHKRSTYTETEQPVLYPAYCQTNFVERRSVSTQTDSDQRSQSTQTRLDDRKSISLQTSTADCSSTSTNTDANSGRNALKRKISSSSTESTKCHIIIKNYDSVNRGVFDYKIPKHSENNDMDSRGSKVPKGNSSRDAGEVPTLRQDIYQTGMSQPKRYIDSSGPQSALPKLPKDNSSGAIHTSKQEYYETGTLPQPQNNFEMMKVQLFAVLQRPCLKFLKYENCTSYCKYNHFLPSAADVAEKIKGWTNEQVHFLYLAYVQRYKMCHQMYFDVICTAFVERRSPDMVIATIKHCESLSLESQFIVILFALKNCGYTDDDALFEICTHANRSRSAINEIFKVIVTFKMENFKRTIAFLSAEMDAIDFDPYFGNEILKQAVEIKLTKLDDILLKFCCGIVRKYSSILRKDYMKSLMSKIELH